MFQNINYKVDTIAKKALEFAAYAHTGQLRKYTDVPYITHCIHVAEILKSHGVEDEKLISAAYLHDTLEDTETDESALRRAFGDAITQLVLEVTDISRPENGNRRIRKEIDCAHIAEASPDGQLLKLADLISNTMSITVFAPKFAAIYLGEKERLLSVIQNRRFGLWDSANSMLVASQTYLKSLEWNE